MGFFFWYLLCIGERIECFELGFSVIVMVWVWGCSNSYPFLTLNFGERLTLCMMLWGRDVLAFVLVNLSTIKGRIWCILVFLPTNYRGLLFLHLWLVLNHTEKKAHRHTTNQLNLRLLQVLDSLGTVGICTIIA